MERLTCYLLILLATFGKSSQARAWGERGHQTVTLVAVRLVEARLAESDPDWVRILRQKEQMLAHLSNVPDIVWRSLPREISRLNAPAHYLDLEFILKGSDTISLADLPKTMEEYRQAILITCEKSPKHCAPGKNFAEQVDKTGHASFRSEQLLDMMEQSLSELTTRQKKGEVERSVLVDLVDRALLYGGLAAHFIGDLGNPMHTTMNFDGQLTGQRGLHRYFETQVVAAYPLDLNAMVLAYAQRATPFKAISRQQKPSIGKQIRFATRREEGERRSLHQANEQRSRPINAVRGPDLFAYNRLEMIWALTIDSYAQLSRLLSLDRKHSLIQAGDQFLTARRHPPAAMQQYYRQLIVERLATAADALAELWIDVWRQSGRPDVAGYQSFTYHLQPEFIPSSYLDLLENLSQDETIKKPATQLGDP